MSETRAEYMRKVEAHMRDTGQWPEEPGLDAPMRSMLQRQWEALQPVEREPYTTRELELLSALRTAFQAMIAAHLEKSRGCQAARACLDKHDPKSPADRDQMALWSEPWPGGDAE